MYKFKRLVSVILALSILLSLAVPIAQAKEKKQETAEKPESVFTDVAEKEWFYEDVCYTFEQGLLMGTDEDTFSPWASLTRAMAVTVLGRMGEMDPESYTKQIFHDVDPETWYGPSVQWAAEKNITKGTGKGLFSPDMPVTREQMAVFLYRYLLMEGEAPEMGEP